MHKKKFTKINHTVFIKLRKIREEEIDKLNCKCKVNPKNGEQPPKFGLHEDGCMKGLIAGNYNIYRAALDLEDENKKKRGEKENQLTNGIDEEDEEYRANEPTLLSQSEKLFVI